MKICRFDRDRMGVVEGDTVVDVTETLARLPAYRVPLPRFDPVIEHLDELRPHFLNAMRNGRRLAVKEVSLLAPVANPGKIVAAPVNYKKHLDEAIEESTLNHGVLIKTIQTAGLFLKATSSVIGPSVPVLIRHPERRNDHEIELAVIIGRRGSNITKDQALEHVAGYSIGIDVTLRGPEERSFRKSLDTFTVLGPWMVTADELRDATGLDLALDVDGEARQRANTRDLIMDVPSLIAFASSFYTLEAGDILLTGTPEGVGPITAGGVMDAAISKIGSMTIRVENTGKLSHSGTWIQPAAR